MSRANGSELKLDKADRAPDMAHSPHTHFLICISQQKQQQNNNNNNSKKKEKQQQQELVQFWSRLSFLGGVLKLETSRTGTEKAVWEYDALSHLHMTGRVRGMAKGKRKALPLRDVSMCVYLCVCVFGSSLTFFVILPVGQKLDVATC